MKFFNIKDHCYSPEFISIMQQFLDVDFISLTKEEKLDAFRDLDNFIHRVTGQPKLKLVITENKEATLKGKYNHNYDGSFENEYAEFVYRNESELHGVNMLLIYLHEKFHQFQYRSIVLQNPEVDEEQLQIWTWCADYIDSTKESSINYLCNPIEADAFKHQYYQILEIFKFFVDKKKMHRSVLKALKKEREDLWITLDINADYAHETYQMIERARRNYNPERIFGKKIRT